MEIELSFCIPTYNREQSVTRLVKDILLCQDSSLEVVVLDNGSTDNTLKSLHTIKDDRLSIFANDENKGALYNMINVLDKGRGKYLVYSTDQDYVDSNSIHKFKLFLLQHPDLSCGYCEFHSKSDEDCQLFPSGYQAISNIAYKTRHPTGYFFNNTLLKPIRLVERFSDRSFVDLFPLEFVFAELCLVGDAGIYNCSLFTPETGAMVVNHKSSTTNGNSTKAFFSPQTRLKLAINFAKHLHSLQLTLQQKLSLMVDLFIRGLVAATIEYRSTMRNKDLCIHYYMERRNIGPAELTLIGVNFYKTFVRETNEMWAGDRITRIRFKAQVVINLLRKTVIKLRRL